jgi:hypothetical protein
MSFILIGLIGTALCCLHTESVLTQSVIWVVAALIAIGDVIAYSALVTLYSNAVAAEHQGKVMGVCFVVVALVWSVMGLLGGKLMSYNLVTPLLVAPLGALIAIILLFFFDINTQSSDLPRLDISIK